MTETSLPFFEPPPPYESDSDSDTTDGGDPMSFFWMFVLNFIILAILCSIYSVLRKKTGDTYKKILTPRALLEDESDDELKALDAKAKCKNTGVSKLPVDPTNTLSYVRSLMALSEDELLPHVGLDGVLFLRVIDMGYHITGVMSIAACVLALVYCFSEENSWIDDSDDGWEIFISLGIVPYASGFLAFPVILSYLCTFAIIAILEIHSKKALALRKNWLEGMAAPGAQFYAIMVRDIPTLDKHETPASTLSFSSFKDSITTCARCTSRGIVSLGSGSYKSSKGGNASVVIEYFSQMYQQGGKGGELAASVVPQLKEVQKLKDQRDKAAIVLEKARTAATMQPRAPDVEVLKAKGAWYKCETLDETVTQHLARLEADLTDMRAQVMSKSSTTAIVILPTIQATQMASKVLHAMMPMSWDATAAPVAEDIDWDKVLAPWWMRYARGVLVPILVFIVLIFFFIPVALLATLCTVANLTDILPFVKPVVEITFIANVLEGFLPGLALTICLAVAPMIFHALSKYRCTPTMSQQVAQAIAHTFLLFVIDVFLGAAFTQAVMGNLEGFVDDFSITSLLEVIGLSIPGSAFLFTSVICAKWSSGVGLEVTRVVKFLLFHVFNLLFKTRTVAQQRDFWRPVPFPYLSQVPWVLFIILLACVYGIVAPLLAPFAWFFFVCSRVLWRNQLLFVYQDPCDTGGSLWSYYISSLVKSLIIAQVMIMAVLITKGSPLLMMLELILVFITVSYSSIGLRVKDSFDSIPMEVAAGMDAKHGDADANKLVLSYIPPVLTE